MRDPGRTGYAPNLVPGVTAEEKITVTTRHVGCDGGGGALGHPLIYLRLEGEEITCPYCSRTFVLAPGAGADDNHH
ncbi:zinc-finger domain-containing protein [Roseomonas sp. CCTCC AB2023176]|uniref:zinc-finger domain-containing protein n=1 Tax=Roseomonas sp. CCTCC AB2023176 TaxID=3342640 RepID=UPI0035DD6AB1